MRTPTKLLAASTSVCAALALSAGISLAGGGLHIVSLGLAYGAVLTVLFVMPFGYVLLRLNSLEKGGIKR